MSMQFIYGRAGTGKTEYCLTKIKQYISEYSLDTKFFVIVPEQFSYSIEKKLLEILGTGSSVNAEVINFKRIADRVFKEVGGAINTNLSKVGKAMLLNNILDTNSTVYLSKSNENVDLLLRTITELKKHNITTKILSEQIDKTEDVLLKTKLEDIYKIYNSYEEKIKDNFIDEEDKLTLLSKKLDESNMFENSYVFIDEFSGFTSQEYSIIEKIMSKATKVYITVCTNNLEDPLNPDTDIFYTNKKTVKKLITCAENQEIKIEKPINLETKYRFKNEELKFLEENIYGIPYKVYDNKIKNINLNLYSNPYEEIENIAKTIVELVKLGRRYRNIAIITQNLEEYSSIAKVLFEKYNIPIYIDEKGQLSKKILIKYVLSILDIFAKNWSNEAVWTYIKTGFLEIEKQDIYLLENYCKKWGIKRNKWYQGDFKYESQEIDIDKINNLRKIIVEPLRELQIKINKNKTAKEITQTIYEFLEQNKIKEKLNEKIKYLENINQKQLANEYIASWDSLMNVLDELVLVFNNDKMSFENYRKTLKRGLEIENIGTIPQGMDQVMFGNIERSRTHKVKTMFIVGVNDGVFPAINKDEGFLNDDDRNVLKTNGIEMANGTLENIYEDEFNTYKAFSTAEEEIYLSYVSSNKDGKAKRPSILINRIKKIFPKIYENSEIKTIITNKQATFGELLIHLRNKKNGDEIDEIWDEIYDWYISKPEWKEKIDKACKGFSYTNETEVISKENIEKLYGETLKTSVSRLEQYKRCPFSFYLKYGLNLKQEEEYAIKSIDTGSFMHDVIDTFFSKIKNVKGLNEKEILDIVNEIINDKLNLNKNHIFSSSPKFIALTNRLKKVIVQSITYIVEQIKNSSFEQEGHEVEFSRKIDNVQITGKIDRIDSVTTENGKYIRIIDYKSSTKDINLNEFLAGTQIQLITYIDSITDNNDWKPAGILYFNLIDPIIKASKNLSDEEIKEEIKKNFKMKGMVLADVNVIRLMDKSLEKGYSKVIPVYMGKDGQISESNSNTVTKEEFNALEKTARRLIKKISKDILNGKIDIKPIYNKKNKTSSCKFCEYKTICKFNAKINNYEYIENRKKEQILEEIREEK